jgi:hypothetical protein
MLAIGVIVPVVMSAAAVPALAAAPTHVESGHDALLFANASVALESGCLTTWVSIFAHRGTSSRGGGALTDTSGAVIEVLTLDNCAQVNTLRSFGFVDFDRKATDVFTIDPRLDAAHFAVADVPLFEDETGNRTGSVSVDLSWVATGPPISDRTFERIIEPDLLVVQHCVDTARDASANGTVSLVEATTIPVTGVISGPAVSARLFGGGCTGASKY